MANAGRLRTKPIDNPLETMLLEQETQVLAGVPKETREALGLESPEIAPPPAPPEKEPVVEPPAPPEAPPAAAPPSPEPLVPPEPAPAVTPPEPASPAAPPVAAAAPPAVPQPPVAPVAEPPGGFPWRELKKLRKEMDALKSRAPALPTPETPLAPSEQPPAFDAEDPLGIKAAARAMIEPEIQRLERQQQESNARLEQDRQRVELQSQEATFRAKEPAYDEAAVFLIKSARDEYEDSGADKWRGSMILKGAETDSRVRAAVDQVADQFNISDEEAARRIAVDLYVTEQYNNIRNGAAAARQPLPEVVWRRAVARGFTKAAPAPAPAPAAPPMSPIERARRLNAAGPSLGNMQSGGAPAPRQGAAPPKTKAEYEQIVRDGLFTDQLSAAWDRMDPKWDEKLA